MDQDETIDVSRSDLYQLFFYWETLYRSGQCMPRDEVRKLHIEDVAERRADWLWTKLNQRLP